MDFTNPLPGDLILYPVTPHSEFISRLVQAGELIVGAGKGFEGYSHVAILTRPGVQFEYKWPRAGHFPIDKSRTYEYWQIPGLTDAQREAILDECDAREGQLYNMIGLLTGGLLGLPRTAVCSQGAGEIYAKAAGITFSTDGEILLSPNAMVDYPGARMLQRVAPGTLE